jgi:hypothetical protein
MEGTVSLDLSQRSLWKLIPIYDADKDFGFYFVWLDPEAADAFNISPSQTTGLRSKRMCDLPTALEMHVQTNPQTLGCIGN